MTDKEKLMIQRITFHYIFDDLIRPLAFPPALDYNFLSCPKDSKFRFAIRRTRLNFLPREKALESMHLRVLFFVLISAQRKSASALR